MALDSTMRKTRVQSSHAIGNSLHFLLFEHEIFSIANLKYWQRRMYYQELIQDRQVN
jgi:hypothetical protein